MLLWLLYQNKRQNKHINIFKYLQKAIKFSGVFTSNHVCCKIHLALGKSYWKSSFESNILSNKNYV